MVEAVEDAIPLDEGAQGSAREADMVDDPAIYNASENSSNLYVDALAAEFSVRNPQDFNGHIVYEVTGRDDQGVFECKRRYNEFYVLRDQLVKRWPGCPIPRLPGKQTFGNKDLVFIQERRYYLERFLRKLAHFGYVINGQEFQMFARPAGPDVERALSKLPKMSS